MFILNLSFMQSQEPYDVKSSEQPFAMATSTDNSGAPPSTQNHEMAGSVGTHCTSRSIPLPSSHVARTHSEVQLSIDEQLAEARDVNMFYRLVNGIRERHQEAEGISGLVQTRMTPLQQPKATVQDETNTPFPDVSVQIPSLVKHQEESAGDSWSITGFSPTDEGALPGALDSHHKNYDTDDEDTEIFAMDM